MGIEVKLNLPPNPGVELRTGIRRGLAVAGKETLAVSDLLAPREDIPRHGVHMTETGFVRVEPGVDEDAVTIGYGAFWAVFQNEDLTYHHPNGGQAKFLDTALLRSPEAFMEAIAAAVEL